jgi:MinD superfamily P-loop ATPase
MIVAVASGKGGTGKTTVATSLALVAASAASAREAPGVPGSAEPLFLDCDVEEPNAGLLLKPVLDEREDVGIQIPQVDEDRCTYCGRCAEVCVWNAIAVVRRKVLVLPELCHGCGSCTLSCPEGAIHEVLRVTGSLEAGRVCGLRFARGTLNVGEAMAVPVIRALKSRHMAVSSPAFAVLDLPPGTSCPVVEAMRGADFALLVTEPTPFGLHDLRLAVQVARDELGLDVGVVINRDGVGDVGVDDYCAAQGLDILMRIPLDRRIAEAVAAGEPLVEALPEYRPRFHELYERLSPRTASRVAASKARR